MGGNMRIPIFQIDHKKTYKEEYQKIMKIFMTKCVHFEKKDYTYFDFINEFLFHNWKYRDTYLDCYEYLDSIGIHMKNKKISKEAIDKANKTKIEKGIHLGEKNPISIISDNKARDILEYYLNNEISIVELSKIHNVSYNIVSNLIKNKSYKHIMKDKREEIKNKSNNLYKAKLDKVKELYNNNYSQNQIAKILKISRNTIRKIISN